MSHRISLFGLLAAGVLLWSSAASAADLDPGYAQMPSSIPQQVVTFGSGWYIRGDIGVTDKYTLDVDKTPFTKVAPVLSRSQDVGYDLTAGGGYSFTNSFRVDVTADFLQPVERSGTDRTLLGGVYRYNFYGLYNHYAALVNGYYDFGTWSIFTPYVGAGAGLGFGNIRAYSFAPLEDQTYLNYYNFAWAAMAGVAIDIYSHTKLDIGYRYLNMGNVAGTKLYDHQIRAGIRYMIDN